MQKGSENTPHKVLLVHPKRITTYFYFKNWQHYNDTDFVTNKKKITHLQNKIHGNTIHMAVKMSKLVFLAGKSYVPMKCCYFTRFTIKTFPDDESVNLKHVEIVEMD